MPHNTLIALMENIAMLVIPLFAHRFPMIGSLYDGPDPSAASNITSSLATPTPTSYTRLTNISDAVSRLQLEKDASKEFHVGPIVSWPFFGSARGDLAHPEEINRGPWRTTRDYLQFGPGRMLATLRFMIDDRIEANLARMAAPVLVVRGEHDPIASLAWVEQAAAVAPRGEWAVVPDAAHAANYDEPDALAHLVRAFLARVEARS